MRTKNLCTLAVVLGCAVLLAECGGSPAQPTTTPPVTVTPPASAAPVIKLDLQADEARSRDAVTLLSDVLADTSGSTGTGVLSFAIDFGDGTSATTAVARHAYGGPGTYAVTATVTDARGQKATDTRPVTVKNVSGRWFHAGIMTSSHRVEVRRLTVLGQDGLTVRGVYQVSGAVDRPFVGTLTKPRNLRILVDGGTTLEGVLPGQLGDDAQTLALVAQGDTLNGARLEFQAIRGEPSGSAPDADLRMSFGRPNDWAPLAALTPVAIDGGRSSGADLMYFIEFGDDFVVTGPQATHVVDPPNSLTPSLRARVTVVDRYGRSDAESSEYFVYQLGVAEYAFQRDYWSAPDGGPDVEFLERKGLNYVGRARLGYSSASSQLTSATATLSEGPRIRIVLPEVGIEYAGTIEMSAGNNAIMTVIQRGGAEDGKTWRLYRRSYY